MKTATFIKNLDWKGDARLYKLSEPIDYEDRSEDIIKTNYVIVSAVHVSYSGPETYVFPADSEGEELSMLELNGSFKGDLDHEKALDNAGYTLLNSVIDIEFEEVKPLQLDK